VILEEPGWRGRYFMGIDERLCKEMNLAIAEIKGHYRLAKQVLGQGKSSNFLEIITNCTTANNMVLSSKLLAGSAATSLTNCHFAAFVPSAGAATRYLDQLSPVVGALRAGSFGEARSLIESQFLEKMAKWCLPERASRIFQSPEACADLSEDEAIAICNELSMPKALFPCVREGTTFLQMKDLEHRRFRSVTAQVFIAPSGMTQQFFDNLNQGQNAPGLETIMFEQDGDMLTIRLDTDGEPLKDSAGKYSTVPAGHGALVKLIPKVKARLPDVDAVFIRNIDNVSGGGAESIAVTGLFLNFYGQMLEKIRGIRSELSLGNVKAAADFARDLLNLAGISSSVGKDSSHREDLSALMKPMTDLFHSATIDSREGGLEHLQALYSRPLNVFGVVQNNGTDLGGTPVVVKDALGNIKVCLEIPHASPADCDVFIRDPKRATHFNPVFVGSEVVEDIHCYDIERSPFWLFSKKQWQGKQVAYYETVLFEILGNSRMANVIFLEVPRLIFNPHKTLDDSKGRSLIDWSIR
jgi:hypothetical protein